MTWRGYIGIENLALTAAQRDTLAAVIRKWGQNNHPLPNFRNHTRVSLDGQKVIFEASFKRSNLTAETIGALLALIFSVNPTLVTSILQSTSYGPMVTYSYSGSARLRFLLFGSLGSGWIQSHAAAVQYIHDNLNEWEDLGP